MTDRDHLANRLWVTREHGRLVGRGHPAGDFLEAWAWEVLERDAGHLRVSAHLPDHVRNPRGQLFGGFTPTYVDLIALFTVHSRTRREPETGHRWLATTSMRVDYLAPVVGPKFILDSCCENHHGRTHFVVTRFEQDGELAVMAATTLREVGRGSAGADASRSAEDIGSDTTPRRGDH